MVSVVFVDVGEGHMVSVFCKISGGGVLVSALYNAHVNIRAKVW